MPCWMTASGGFWLDFQALPLLSHYALLIDVADVKRNVTIHAACLQQLSTWLASIACYLAFLESKMACANGIDDTTMLSLPDDLLINIGSYLDDKGICSLERANGSIYTALLSPSRTWPCERTLNLNVWLPTLKASTSPAR